MGGVVHGVDEIDAVERGGGFLAIAGGEDSSVTPAEMEAFAAAPGGCAFHALPGAGHFAAYEQPRKVAALMAPWLRQFDL